MKLLYSSIALAVVLVMSMAITTAYADTQDNGAIKEMSNKLKEIYQLDTAPIIEPEPPQPPQSPPNNENNGGGGSSCDSLCRWYRQIPTMRKQCFNDLAEELKPKITKDMTLMDIFPPLSNPNYWLCSGDVWGMFKPFF